VIDNAAREPEINGLARCLVAMGAEIAGIGTERLVIQGKERLHGADHEVMPDRIEAGQLCLRRRDHRRRLDLDGARASDMTAILDSLREAGVVVTETERGIRVEADGRPRAADALDRALPAFPTDMQAQFMAMLALADGASVLTESIFENRYMHVPSSAGWARTSGRGRSAVVRGVDELAGAEVMATDLRASMSLILAGLAAAGETSVHRIYHLDRGYERLEEKLSAVGADIERVGGD
jgi:UDP-N-acetylglucosamine 1-carboxyvinyltransferase